MVYLGLGFSVSAIDRYMGRKVVYQPHPQILSPGCLYSASDQELEPGMAWERG